ncbi:MAG: sulfite exporter TauE/SafE family protein [Nitrososphaeraceae archaeon]
MIDIIILLIIIGTGAGFLGSLIGLGGGIIMTPILTLMGFSPTVVASSSLLAVTATSLSSTITYSIKKSINYSLGLKLALFAIPGSIFGGFLSSYVTLSDFKLYFAILLLIVGIYIFYKEKINTKDKSIEIPKYLNFILFSIGTFSAGIISSFFGVGGGIIFIPIMIFLFKLKIIDASPTAQFTLLISSSIGLATHIVLGHPEYFYGFSLAIGSFLGAQIGSRYLHKFKESLLSKIFSISLIGISLQFFYDLFVKPFSE